MAAYRIQSTALCMPRVQFLYVSQGRQNGVRSVDVLHRFGIFADKLKDIFLEEDTEDTSVRVSSQKKNW